MALQFVVGGSGSGKTEWLYSKLLAWAEENKKQNFYMIVPDQFTLQTQKALVDRHKNHAIMNIDVVSFDRLAYRIFDELGKTDLVVLEDTGKNLILRKLAEDCKDQLKTLKNQIHKISYIDQIKSLISEFMQYGIEPEDLESYLDKMDANSALYYKLSDMLLLYQSFDRYLRSGYITSEKILSVLADSVKESALLKDAVLAFDGFTGFTPVQMKLVKELLSVAKESYMTVTMDPDEELYADKGIQDLFYMSRKMIRSVAKLAKEVGCDIADPVPLQNKKGRFCSNPVLCHLEQNLFRPASKAFAGNMEGQSGISIASFANPKDELIYAAAKIRSMVKECGYRYQDFAIVSGNVGGYEKYAKEVFEMYQVPYFADVKETIYYHPFTEWVRAFIEMIDKGFDYDSVFRYLRCGLSGFSMDEIDILDNYVLEKGIRGYKKWREKWVRPFKQASRGAQKTQEEQTAALLQLNQLRERFVAQVEPVFTQIQSGMVQVSEVTKALYQAMVQLDSQQQLKAKQEYHEQAGNEYLAATYAQIYRIVIDLLDKVVDLLGEDHMPIKEYAQILDAGFLAAKVGTIPPGADCVTLGDIERTRLDNIKVLFFLGVNDGIVPKLADRKNLLSQYDRERMNKDNIELAPTTREQVFLQKFYLYLNMTKPQDRLFLTFARMDSMGTAQKPSYLVSVIGKMFPELKVVEIEADYEHGIMTAQSSVKKYLTGIRQVQKGQVTKDWVTLHQYRLSRPECKHTTERMLDAAYAVYNQEVLSPELARKLYGQQIYASVTRIEKYYKCAYAHFLQYGLKLAEREENRFEAADMGLIFHNAIECYCKKMFELGYDWFTISQEQQEKVLDEAVSETLLSMDTKSLLDSARNQYMTVRMSNILRRSVDAMTSQLRRGDYVPAEYEVGFYQKIDMSDVDCEDMVITGRIDRIDTYDNDEQLYVKIADYKSSKKDFDLQNIYDGQDIQLVLYLYAAIEKMKNEQKKEDGSNVDIIPAAMLYYHLDDPTVEAETDLTEEEIDQAIFKKFRPTGLVNEDSAVIYHLDKDLSGSSEVIPVSVNKDGTLSKRGCSVATREQLEVLEQFVVDKIRQAGKAIMEGEIGPHPLESSKIDGCEYCSYKDICGFDTRISGYKKRVAPKYSEEDIWAKIYEETDYEC